MNPRIARALVTVFISAIAVCAFTVGFVQHAIDQNNQKFCTVLATITGAPLPDDSLQPKTAYGKQLQAYNAKVTEDLNELQRQYKCVDSKEKP